MTMMTKQEAKQILTNWVRCAENEGIDTSVCNYDCENCDYNSNYEQLMSALPIAIECIEKCEHLNDDTLEMASEYIDDCICTYETAHEYLERKGRDMCRY